MATNSPMTANVFNPDQAQDPKFLLENEKVLFSNADGSASGGNSVLGGNGWIGGIFSGVADLTNSLTNEGCAVWDTACLDANRKLKQQQIQIEAQKQANTGKNTKIILWGAAGLIVLGVVAYVVVIIVKKKNKIQ